MSSSDRAFRRPGILLALAALMTVAACTMQPLYGRLPSGRAVGGVLSQISIDPVNDRVSQEVRNQLLFLLSGNGADATSPVYRMTLNVSFVESALGITPVASAPAYSVAVTASYQVTAIATGKIVLRDTSRGTTSYDRINQAYANSRAALDAQNRAAEVVAEDIRTRLAAAVAKGTL